MNNTFGSFFMFSSFAVGLIGTGYAIGSRKKMNDICGRIDTSLNNLSDRVEIDIPQSLIDKAIDKALDREVERAVGTAANNAVREIKMDIHKEVKKAVNETYSDIKSSVTEELKRQVANVDISEARREVIREAKQIASKKFNSSLDDILEKFNGDLNNISSIYKSIANAITRDGEKNVTLKLT